MDFVDRHRAVQAVRRSPAGHPRIVAPLIVEIPDDRCVLRGCFIQKSNRIGLGNYIVVRSRLDVVFVSATRIQIADESLPQSRSGRLKEVLVGLPVVEIPNHRYRFGVRGPYAQLLCRRDQQSGERPGYPRALSVCLPEKNRDLIR